MSKLVVLALGALAAPPLLAAQSPLSPRTDSILGGTPARPRTSATRLKGSIRIDGRLDEESWSRTPVASNFIQSWPAERAPATDSTQVRVLYDSDALYVGVKMFDAHPDSIAAQLARRDASGIYSDWVHVVVDSYYDRRTAFRFSLNPKGVQKDVRHFDDGNEDLNWDAVWEAGTSIDRDGWTAEIRIPFSQLRFSRPGDGSAMTWGFQVQRDVARRGERSGWSFWGRQSGGYVSSFGDLEGLADLPQPGRLELLPYVSSTLTRELLNTTNPFYSRNDGSISVGGDFKYGLTSGLTLNGTINPDFGQVELDPAVVNLSQYETFLAERRPFFIEGADLFRFGSVRANNRYGGGQYFYSRRIGRLPQRGLGRSAVVYEGHAPDQTVVPNSGRVTFSDPPSSTTILGAAKVSGKTPGGWTVAILDAVTQREEAPFQQTYRVVSPSGDTTVVTGERAAPVEPLTNYFVGRTRRDLRGGSSVVGGMLTAVNRERDPAFRSLLRQSAYSGGIDFDHRWANRTWSLNGYLAGSLVRGDSTVITNAQRGAQRYYQRPDADHLRVDSSRTSLTGYSGAISLYKSGGGPWFGSLVYQETSPGLELNDFGFQSDADRRAVSTFLGYQRNKPSRYMRNWVAYGFTNQAWNMGGDPVFDAYSVGAETELASLWYLSTNLRYSPPYLSDRLTRGGPLVRVVSQQSANVGVSTDSRKPLIVGVNGNIRTDDAGEYGRTISLDLDMRPSTFLRVLVSPYYSARRDVDFWVTSATGGPAATFGRREVFASLDNTEVGAPVRVNWTFTPRLTLELVAQPFISANRIYGFKELRRARSFDFARYGQEIGTVETVTNPKGEVVGYTIDPTGGPGDEFSLPNLDFTLRSLRGSAVVRWEYRPGSALFLVWQQTRSDAPPFGDFEAERDIRRLLSPRPRNVFAIKATYWIAR